MAETTKNYIQILTYIRRKPTLTPAEFYDHWENVHGPKVIPWAEKHGIRRYQQIHTAGSMVPIPSSSSAPNAVSKSPLPTTPVAFDGIAMFLVPSLKQFTDAFQDPYYVQVIEPDEQVLIDKEGPGGGVVASFSGEMKEMVDGGVGVVGKEGDGEYREVWRRFEEGKE